jgi:hypothetical protein
LLQRFLTGHSFTAKKQALDSGRAVPRPTVFHSLPEIKRDRSFRITAIAARDAGGVNGFAESQTVTLHVETYAACPSQDGRRRLHR